VIQDSRLHKRIPCSISLYDPKLQTSNFVKEHHFPPRSSFSMIIESFTRCRSLILVAVLCMTQYPHLLEGNAVRFGSISQSLCIHKPGNFSDVDLDRFYMRRAIELASRAIGKTSPNPCVGCVLVKDGSIIGEGYHKKAGEAHAEVNALLEAGKNAEGATAYVSLEPCNHYGRTPPCTHALTRYVTCECYHTEPRYSRSILALFVSNFR
jgi:deoxycytidylate deaminase